MTKAGIAHDIAHEIAITASPAVVYNALTDAKKLEQWWTPNVRGESTVGADMEFRFGDFCQGMKVVELLPDKLVRWTATDAGAPDWVGSEIEFMITSNSTDEVRFQFRHSGFPGDVERLPIYSMTCAIFIISLKDFLERGTGYPFPNHWMYQSREQS
jgi:uncharacterized protein YndB with AHSA1/START domain